MNLKMCKSEKSYNIAAHPTVVLNTGKVHPDRSSCTHYYAGVARVVRAQRLWGTFFDCLLEVCKLAHPQFFLARGQGKSPPRLHKARVEVNRIKAVVTWRPTLPLPTHAAKL